MDKQIVDIYFVSRVFTSNAIRKLPALFSYITEFVQDRKK